MRFIIKEDYKTLSLWAADLIQACIELEVAEKGYVVLGFPTGSTVIGVYGELVRRCKTGELSFADVYTFNMDEYLGIPASHPQSYHSFMWEYLFSHIDIKKERIHLFDGMTKDPVGDCLRYEEAMQKLGGVDLFLGGVGPNGHIAFNEPGSSLSSRSRVKTLTAETRRVNARFFDSQELAPEKALTVGIGTLLDAKELLFLVSGENKAKALRDAVEGPLSHNCPLSILQLHRHATIACDEAATDELKVGTVRYYRQIMA